MGNGGIASPFLTSALDGGEWLASHSSRYTLGEPAVHIGLEAVIQRISNLNPYYCTLFTAWVETRNSRICVSETGCLPAAG
jgi:hypothetical protein